MTAIVCAAAIRWKNGKILPLPSGRLSSRKPGEPPVEAGCAANAHTRVATLLATAHASSFSSALLHELRLAASSAGELSITATVTLTRALARWTITGFHISVVSRLPAITQNRFIDAIVRAKKSCLVSRSLRTNVTLNATLESWARPGLPPHPPAASTEPTNGLVPLRHSFPEGVDYSAG